MEKPYNSSKLSIWILIIIIIYGFLLYIPSLPSKDFYFDDQFAIQNNMIIKSLDIPKIFNAFNTRFLVGLSFALNYCWCSLHPAGYRCVNLLIHCLNAFLVYVLVKSTLNIYTPRKRLFFCRLEWPAFFASLLFLCHPVQTEPVNFITQRFVLMGTFFYLLTLFFYIQYRCRFKKRYMMAAGTSAIAAMFCKEFVVTLPFMLALYDIYFLPKATIARRCKSLLPFFIIVLIVPLLLLRTPQEAIGVADIAYTHQDNNALAVDNHRDITKATGNLGRQSYFFTELHVVCTYVRILFLPINQNLDYEYPISYHMDAGTALCGLFLFFLLVLAMFLYRFYRLISFSIAWFFLALSVESSVIPIGHVIAEYRLYLASVGFVFLVTSLVYARKTDIRPLNIAASVILIGFSILTYQRNNVWKDEFTLWNDTVQKSPHKARALNSRGLIYAKRGKLDYAVADYTKAIEIDPNYTKAYYNRALSYDQQGLFAQAIADYTKVIEINPGFAKAYDNRGFSYEKEGYFAQAIVDYDKGIALDPDSAQVYNDRGTFYAHQGNWPAAMADLAKAIGLDPHDAKTYYNRGLMYALQGEMDHAVADYSKAIDINAEYADAYYNRGLSYARQKKFAQAIADLNADIKINPKDAEAYNNRAVIYYQLKIYDKAWSDVHKAQELGVLVDPKVINALKAVSAP